MPHPVMAPRVHHLSAPPRSHPMTPPHPASLLQLQDPCYLTGVDQLWPTVTMHSIIRHPGKHFPARIWVWCHTLGHMGWWVCHSQTMGWGHTTLACLGTLHQGGCLKTCTQHLAMTRCFIIKMEELFWLFKRYCPFS